MRWDEVVQKGYDKFLKDHQDLEYVVRCKDCKHGIPTRIDTVTGEFSDERYCWLHRMCHFEDYYCADGKRNEGGTE